MHNCLLQIRYKQRQICHLARAYIRGLKVCVLYFTVYVYACVHYVCVCPLYSAKGTDDVALIRNKQV